MREVFIAGIGMHRVGRFEDTTTVGMAGYALKEALKDSGFAPGDIRLAAFSNRDDPSALIGQHALGVLGLCGIPVYNVENASCSGHTSFWMAWQAVASEQVDVALAIGSEKLVKGLRIPIATVGADMNQLMAMAQMGFGVIPGVFALVARRRMFEYGETPETFAQVSVKNHHHATLNPIAHYRMETPLEEVLNSRPIADPITLLQCCPTSEGAAAVVLCSKEKLKHEKRAVSVAACVLRSPEKFKGAMLATAKDLSKDTANEAYGIAGVGPKDLDVIELHEPFTPNEILHYEDLGLCQPGEGGRFLMEGHTKIGGRIPVNPSGGLLARGHPIGCTGLYQIGEIVLQLRQEAKERQIEGAKVGLAHLEGIGPIASVIILKR